MRTCGLSHQITVKMAKTSRGLLHDYEPSDGPSFESLVCIPGGICGVLRSIKPCFVMQLDSVHQVARCASSYQLGRLRHEKHQTVCTGECLN